MRIYSMHQAHVYQMICNLTNTPNYVKLNPMMTFMKLIDIFS